MSHIERALIRYGEGLLADKNDTGRDFYLKDCLLDIQQIALELYRAKQEELGKDIKSPQYMTIGKGEKMKIIEVL